MSSPKFSVITCTRNSASTLPDTIESVNKQSFRDFEHIFVDGNSTDETLEIIRKMSPNARVIEGVVGGISRAMNTGVEHATGEVIVHLHSDDFFATPDVLEAVSAAFADASVNWVVGNFEYLHGNKRLEGSPVTPLTLGRLGLGNYIPHHSTFIKRDFFNLSKGFDESLRYCMDYELWLRLFSMRPPVHIDKKLAVFRVHSGSVSSANRRATLVEEMTVRIRFFYISPATLPRYFYRFIKRWISNAYVK
jgi:glycosyltransferase involved in cell wall biosynthesis